MQIGTNICTLAVAWSPCIRKLRRASGHFTGLQSSGEQYYEVIVFAERPLLEWFHVHRLNQRLN